MRILTFLCFISVLSACGGSVGENPVAPPAGDSTPIAGLNTPLADTQNVFAELDALADLKRVAAGWLNGSWASFNHDNETVTNSRYQFNGDGSYQYEKRYYDEEQSAYSDAGSWRVYQQTDTEFYYLFLVDGNGDLIDLPMEREGDNGFRLIYPYGRPTAYSSLYARLGSTDAIYPGMQFLGTYETIDYDDDQNHRTVYEFLSDGTVSREVYGDFTYDRALQYRDAGTWSVDNNLKLHLTLNGRTRTFTMGTQSAGSVFKGSLYPEGEDGYEYWTKLFENPVLPEADPLVGEYRSSFYTDYIIVRKENGRYLVDFSDNDYRDLEAEKLPNGNLRMTLPAAPDGYTYYEGDIVELEAGYNHLFFAQRSSASFMVTGGFYQKTTRFPFPEVQPALTGGWITSPSRAFSRKAYLYFLSDGRYYFDNSGSSGIYQGRYSIEGDSVGLKRICEDKETAAIDFRRHYLEFEGIDFGPVPGIATMGDTGLKIKELVFSHKHDLFKQQYGPALSAHPGLDKAYLFAEAQAFTGLNSKLELQSNGDGEFTNWSDDGSLFLTLGLKYFITVQDGLEYFAFYYTGDTYGTYVTSAGSDVEPETVADARLRALYNGRTNLCFRAGEGKPDDGFPMTLY